MPNTREDRVKTVYGGGGHAVILGAGASIAATRRNPEANGKKLPSMDNFIEVVGLADIVSSLPTFLQARNFETLYSQLYATDPDSDSVKEIESRVSEYFSNMQLSDEPTIYDYLVLALRPRDLIATFNWDPFLLQAYIRNRHVGDLPELAFLHGNVAIGYSTNSKARGLAGTLSPTTGDYFEPTKLLYPVSQKNYNNDEFIKEEWNVVKEFLQDESTKRVTIFGYGAPATDIEAVTLLNKAWGTPNERPKEQFELIDIRPESEVRAQWDNFIHSHHYDYCTDYFKSSLATNPRRTSESFFQHYFGMTPGEAFSASNPVPNNFQTLQELWDWHGELVEAEKEWEKNQEAP